MSYKNTIPQHFNPYRELRLLGLFSTLRYNQARERVLEIVEETVETVQRFQEGDGTIIDLHVDATARGDQPSPGCLAPT